MRARISDLVLVKRSSASEWLSRPEGVPALDDGEHLELAALAHQPGHGGVPGLVGGDGPPFRLGVLDRLGQADLLGHLGLLDVVPRQAVGAPAQGPDQRLVEQMLDHHRRVPGGHGRQRRPRSAGSSSVGLVGLLAEVVVDDVAAARTGSGRSK